MKAVLLDEAGAYVRDCAVDEVGVLVIRGPNVFAGYKGAEHNKGLWIDAGDGQRWLNTGDLGRQDADGYFYLTGRKKELIIRGGHNIDPASIEAAAAPAPGRAARRGRRPARCRMPASCRSPMSSSSPAPTATEAELLTFAQDATSASAPRMPKAIRIVPCHAADRRRQDLQAAS